MLPTILLTVFASGLPLDAARVPPDERASRINQAAGRLTDENAAQVYKDVFEEFVSLAELSAKADPEKRELINRVSMRSDQLFLALEVEREEERVIDRWIGANRKCKRLLDDAVELPRCYFDLPTDQRLYKSRFRTESEEFTRVTRFVLHTAAHYARNRRWTRAYEWNLIAHRIIDHLYQQPLPLAQQTAADLESSACRQLLLLIQDRPPRDFEEILAALQHGDDRRCSQRVVREARLLWTRDWIEAWHEWAEHPTTHPDLTKLAQSLTDERLRPINSAARGEIPFDNPRALRRALESTSVANQWDVAVRLDKFVYNQKQRLFHEFWRDRSKLAQVYCDTLREAPSLALGGCGEGSFLARFLRGIEADMLRDGLRCVLALHHHEDKEGRMPLRLGKVSAAMLTRVPIDSFSGRALVYRRGRDKDAFVLYSVGGDGRDDGGKPTRSIFEPGDLVIWPPQSPPEPGE